MARPVVAAATVFALAITFALGIGVTAAEAIPTGPLMPSGGFSVVQSGTTMTITQSTPAAVIDWTDFSIGAGETVDVLQPDSASVALFRVTGSSSSIIAGTLTSNGEVILVNPNGVVVASTGIVKGYGIVLSTGDVTDTDVVDGGPSTFATASTNGASISNEGTIDVSHHAVLIGPQLSNTGTASTSDPGGRLSVVSKPTVVLDDGLAGTTSGTFTSAQGVTNSGALTADRGRLEVLSSAPTAIGGILRAKSSPGEPGQIVIDTGSADATVLGAVLDVSGSGAGAIGGDVDVTTTKLVLDDSAGPVVVSASGDGGGGSVSLEGSSSVDLSAAAPGGVAITADARLTGAAGRLRLTGPATLTGPVLFSASGLSASAQGGRVELQDTAQFISSSGSPSIVARSSSQGSQEGRHGLAPAADVDIAGLTLSTSGSGSSLPLNSSAVTGAFDYGSGLLAFASASVSCEADGDGLLVGTTSITALSSTAVATPALAGLDLTKPDVEVDIAGLGHVTFNQQLSGTGPGDSSTLTVTGVHVTTPAGDELVFLEASCANSKRLAATGTELAGPSGLAGLLLLSGGCLLAVARRSRARAMRQS